MKPTFFPQTFNDPSFALSKNHVLTPLLVVNEALNEDGTYRSSPFYDTIGEAFIPIAFKFAKKYSPKSELFYNDYNLEYNGNKTLGAKRIVKLMSLVASTPDYNEQHLVTNGASELIGEVFGDAGKHARSAFGVASLPRGTCVEIEMIVEVA